MSNRVRLAILSSLVLIFASCTTIYRNHGYVPSDDDLASILVGVDTRESVISVLGRPSSSGVMNANGVYYVASRFRHYAYQEPRAIDRQVVAITFAADDSVKNIERFTLEDGQVVPLTRRVTNSSIESITFLRQLLGNIGNFNAGEFLDNDSDG
ncbi:MAG: outer membrane protein assembly factor BamE [Pseudomonadota bacterium]